MAYFAHFNKFVVAAAAIALPVMAQGCSSANDIVGDATGAAAGCNGFTANASSQAEITVQAFENAANALKAKADLVQADWLKVCNEINGDLMQDTTQTTAAAACGVLNTFIQNDIKTNGVTVALNVDFNCTADVMVQASCNASCNVNAKCDIEASCSPGDFSVACNGTCMAECDVTAPSVACTGMCKGSCELDAAASCTGSCTGSCTAPMWTGTCDVGCTAGFSGSCGGNCNGMCDGKTSSGAACAGKCEGTCSAKATGACTAQCMGSFSGGTCSGMCKGSCDVEAGASCSGKCSGTCAVTNPSAMCTGQCKGGCSVQTAAPSCSGSLSCSAAADCNASCNGQASAAVSCPAPTATVTIVGDEALNTSFQAHLADIGVAFNETIALKDPIAKLAGETTSAISALGSVSAQATSCLVSSIGVMGQASVSINVSVSASAQVSGGSSS